MYGFYCVDMHVVTYIGMISKIVLERHFRGLVKGSQAKLLIRIRLSLLLSISYSHNDFRLSQLLVPEAPNVMHGVFFSGCHTLIFKLTATLFKKFRLHFYVCRQLWKGVLRARYVK